MASTRIFTPNLNKCLIAATLSAGAIVMQTSPDALIQRKDDAASADQRKKHSRAPSQKEYPAGSVKLSTDKRERSTMASSVASNPAVILGLGATTAAILGMMRKSVQGDKLGTQRMMQYRIIAQFFTVLALVAGVMYYTLKFDNMREAEERARKEQEGQRNSDLD